jgi:hypothetical protein
MKCDNVGEDIFHEGDIRTYYVWEGKHYHGTRNLCIFCRENIMKKGVLFFIESKEWSSKESIGDASRAGDYLSNGGSDY